MKFEWDPNKAAANLVKHGISFEDAAYVWDDPEAEFRLAREVDGEERWKAVGQIGGVTILAVIHTLRGEDRVRIISARKASRNEKLQYKEPTA